MKPSTLTIAAGAVASALGLALPSYAGNSCEVKSGAATAALVELYTSEGCSSCPPADRQLNQLQQQLDQQQGTNAPPASIVPLALHVTYWNDLGWQDRLSQKIFDERQGKLVAQRRSAAAQAKASGIVYTPQFFINGAELRGWRDGLSQAIREINAKPALLTITLKTTPIATDRIMLDVAVEPNAGINDAKESQIDGALYVAISESGLVSKVASGENGGTTLRHDDAARAWFGPLQLNHGRGHLQQAITLPAAWNRRHLQAVAFVQGSQDGRILQALSTQQCSQTKGL